MATRRVSAELSLFSEVLGALSPLEPDDIEAVRPLLRVTELAAGEHLLRAGEQAERVAMVVSGLMREYYLLDDGSERTKAFVMRGELTGSLADLLSDSPSTSFAVAETRSRLIVARYHELTTLATKNPRWDRVFRRLIERLYLRKARREYELLALDAAARHQALLSERPRLAEHVKARHIASYLGITPVHLSRLRRRARARSAPP